MRSRKDVCAKACKRETGEIGETKKSAAVGCAKLHHCHVTATQACGKKKLIARSLIVSSLLLQGRSTTKFFPLSPPQPYVTAVSCTLLPPLFGQDPHSAVTTESNSPRRLPLDLHHVRFGKYSTEVCCLFFSPLFSTTSPNHDLYFPQSSQYRRRWGS